MSEVLKAVPAEGRKVRMENGDVLPEEGAIVTRNSYWLRREADGDVSFAPASTRAAADGKDKA